MNGKKAKMIRRMAEAATVGKPAVSHTTEDQVLSNGNIKRQGGIILGDCTRKTYKKLKREAMKIENLSGLMNRNKGLSLSFLLTEFV